MSNLATKQNSIKSSTREEYRILLAEDNQQVSQMMLAVFSYLEVTAEHATSLKGAMSLATQNTFNLAIIDIHLGDDNGLHLTRDLQQIQNDLEIITMTGDNPKSVEMEVRKLGVLYHLVKPFSIDELTTVLRHSIKRTKRNSRHLKEIGQTANF